VIETPVAPAKQGISYANLISSYGRSSSSSSSNNQSRVAISPLYCEQSVPTLQSPKNAVAPSDIIFERPPAGQTTLMSYSSSADYSNSVVQVKNALISEHARQNSHVNPVPLNLNLNLERVSKGAIKKKDIQYIDDEPTPSTSSQVMEVGAPVIGMNRTQTVVSICPSIPDIITRSCSVGYLDNMELIPGEVTLSQLRKETPKRLVLVDRKVQQHRKYRKITSQQRQTVQQAKFKNFKKSISLDSCDVLHDIPNLNKDLNNLFKQMPKLAESSENTEDTEHSSTELTVTVSKKNKLTSTPKRSPKEKFCNFFSSRSSTPILGRKFRNAQACNCSNGTCGKCSKSDEPKVDATVTAKPPPIPKWSKKASLEAGECSKAPREHKRNKNLEIITSFTDSPLFSRKYRASKNEFVSGASAARPHLQSEHNTPILCRRNDRSSSSDSGQPVEITPIEAKTSVSLHTQVGFRLGRKVN
jgi:tubby-related protein 4